MLFTLVFVNYSLLPIPNQVSFSLVFALGLAVMLVGASGYLINDLFDVAIDRVNKPNKVLIDKAFSKKTVWTVYSSLNSLALLIGFLINETILLLLLFCIVSLWGYALFLKKIALLGNILISFLSALVVLILGILQREWYPLALLFAVFAFCISLIREIIKDMEDIEGDRVGQCKTLPILVGISGAKILTIILLIIFFSLLFYLPSLLDMFIPYYLYYCIILGFSFVWLGWKVYISKSKKDFHYLSSFCKAIMLLGMIGMIILQV
jgi:4-hydroxybenzoate polyprenyltransferase